MKKRLIVIGAGGHGKVAVDVAENMQLYSEIAFLDDNKNEKDVLGYPVLGKCDQMTKYIPESDFFVAIGNSKARERLVTSLEKYRASIATLIHPKATVSCYAEIEVGTIVMAGAVVQPGTAVEKGCIINTCASVDHDCQIGAYTHIAVGAHVCGAVSVGNHAWIGAGATVKNDIAICDDVTVGAGATVVKNITESGTYVGVPAHIKSVDSRGRE